MNRKAEEKDATKRADKMEEESSSIELVLRFELSETAFDSSVGDKTHLYGLITVFPISRGSAGKC